MPTAGVDSFMFIFAADSHFASCHASTLVLLPSGDGIAAWFAGTREGAIDVDIWSSVLHDGCWSEPRVIAGAVDEPLWNPVLFLDGTTLYLTADMFLARIKTSATGTGF